MSIPFGHPSLIRAFYRVHPLPRLKARGNEALALQKNCGHRRANHYIEWDFGGQVPIGAMLALTGYLTIEDVRREEREP